MTTTKRLARYGDGTLHQRGRIWWLKYRAGGRWHFESSGSPDKSAAQTLLDTRRGLDAFFAGYRLVAVSSAACGTYGATRQGQGPAMGRSTASWQCSAGCCGWPTSTAALRGCRRSASSEAAPRAVFVESVQFQAIRRRLPVDLQAAVTIAFTYRWRRDEILTLERRQLDLEAGTRSQDPLSV